MLIKAGSCPRASKTYGEDEHITLEALQMEIQAPNEIDSCPGTSFTLDASRSTGGGVRPLEYIWSASPRTCDNYYGVHASSTYRRPRRVRRYPRLLAPSSTLGNILSPGRHPTSHPVLK